jgi:hypothetical protein
VTNVINPSLQLGIHSLYLKEILDAEEGFFFRKTGNAPRFHYEKRNHIVFTTTPEEGFSSSVT